MTEYKQSNEIKKFLKHKKRKKKIRRTIMMTIVTITTLMVFFIYAPIFNIKEIEIQGTSRISSDNLKESLKEIIGENIYIVDEKNIKSILMQDKYIKEVKVGRKGISKLVINIVEESPVFYVENTGVKSIINDELEVIEEVENIDGRNLVKILGIDSENSTIGEKISSDEIYPSILKKFYPYIAQNRENIKFDSIDITDIVNIKGIIGEVKICFGDDSDLHNKMENIYRILLSEEIKLTKGYIDVGFNGPPIIKNMSN